MLRLISGSGSRKVGTPGTAWLWTERTVKIASTAPAAPMRWPVSDFVALIGISGVRSPKTAQKASASRRAPSGVEVPCGLIMSIHSGFTS